MRSFLKKVTVLVMACMLLSGCSKDSQLDDYATNLTGNSSRQSAQEVAVDKEQTETVKKGISKDEIKVGCCIYQTRRRAADIPIRMSLVFRECSRILACRTVR